MRDGEDDSDEDDNASTDPDTSGDNSQDDIELEEKTAELNSMLPGAYSITGPNVDFASYNRNAPELVLSTGMDDSYYVYTMENRSVIPFYCTQNPEYIEPNYLFVASWSGSSAGGEIYYVPYESKIYIEHYGYECAGLISFYNSEFFDGNNWYECTKGLHYMRDDNDNLYPEVIENIVNGYYPAEEYDYTYDVPGYNIYDNWKPFTLNYDLDSFYYYYQKVTAKYYY